MGTRFGVRDRISHRHGAPKGFNDLKDLDIYYMHCARVLDAFAPSTVLKYLTTVRHFFKLCEDMKFKYLIWQHCKWQTSWLHHPWASLQTLLRQGARRLLRRFDGLQNWLWYHMASERPWNLSTRLLHCITSLGSLHIQIFVIYGKTMSVSDALTHNQALLDFVVAQSRLLPLPTIVLGDFNTPISQFSLWPSLHASGFRNLMDLYLLHHGKSMPPTCMETTHPEMAFFSPELVPLVQDIEVLGPEWFATHRPVCFSMKIPTDGLMKKHIRFARQFVELGLDEWKLSLKCD